MSKVLFAGFISVAALGFGAVDYVNQSLRAGVSPMSYGIGAYVGGFSGRFEAAQAAEAADDTRQALREVALRDLLPEAPEGWARRDWDEAAGQRLDKRYDMAKDEFLPDELKNDPMLKLMAGMDKAATAERDAREVYVYERGDELVSIRLKHTPADRAPGGISGLGMQMVAANMNAMSGSDGFAMVGGVAFREAYGLMGMASEERAWRVFTGKIGEELTITLRADASDEAVMALLSAIDYDRLNAMLDVPVDGVGNRAPMLDPAASKALAAERIAAEDEALRAEGREAEARLRAMGAALTPEPDAGDEPATDEAEAAPAGGAGGGFLGGLKAFAKARTSGAGADAPQPAKAEIRVNRLSEGGNCTSGVGKRCSIGN